MAGAFERELTPEQLALLAAGGSKVYNRSGIGVMPPEEAQGGADVVWAMTGIPMMQEGYADASGAFGPEGELSDLPIGVGKMAMGALPYGGPVAKAVMATLPRAATFLGLGGAATGMTSAAEAREAKAKKKAPQVKLRGAFGPEGQPPETELPLQPSKPTAEPTLYDLAAERDPRAKLALDSYKAAVAQNDADMARLSGSYKLEAGRGGSGPRAAAIQQQIKEAQQAASERVAPLQDKLNEVVSPYLPFDQAYPGLSQAWTGVQLSAPMLAALATRGTGRAILNAPKRGLNNAVKGAERALDTGKIAIADRKIAEATSRAARYGDELPSAGGNFITDVAMPAIAGTGLGAELSMLPEQYNKRNTLPGTEDNRLATERLSPENILKTAAPGAALGFLGGLGGSHYVPGRPVLPNVDGAKALGALAGPEAGGAAGYLTRSKEAERALQALDNAPLSPAVTPPTGAKQPDLSGMNTGYTPPAGPKARAKAAPRRPVHRLWNAAIRKAEAAKNKDAALEAIRALPAQDGMTGVRVAVNKGHMARAIKKTQETNGKGLANTLREMKRELTRRNMLKAVAPIATVGLGAAEATRDREQD